MNNEEIIKLEDKYQLQTYKKYPIALVKGKGCKVWDADGKEYTDFYGGHAVALTGHCHPTVVKAIQEQSQKLIFYSNAVYNDVRAEASQQIIKVSPEGLTKVFFCNSGAEANETALKIARKFTGKNEIIAMKNGFHGRTIAALSVTGIDKYRAQFKPLLEHTKFAEFGNIKSVKKLASDNTAAIILEPVQSMAGIVTANQQYFQELKEFCSEKGIVLIFDEIQTGFGRTGKMFAAQYYGVTPDIITCAKGIASGFPMGATIVKNEIAETISFGEQGSTFGGSPLACAAAKASVEAILKENMTKNADEIGKYIKEKLGGLKGVKEIRGPGLLKGIKLETEAKPIVGKLLEKGFIVGTAVVENDVIRLMPPLTIGKKEVDELYAVLKALLEGN